VSFTGGTSVITAVDASDNVVLRQTAAIAFSVKVMQPDAELLQAADILDRYSRSQLDTVKSTVLEVGGHNDYFRAASKSDVVSLMIGLLGFVSAGEGIDEASNAARSASYMAYPALDQPTWQQIVVPLKEGFPGASRLFDASVQELLRTRQWPGLSLLGLKGGLFYYGASFRDQLVETMTDQGVEDALNGLANLADAGGRQAAFLARDIPALQQAVADQRMALDAGVAVMTPEVQRAYAADLRRRAQAALVYSSAFTRQEIMLNSLRGAHETTNENTALSFALKFGGSMLAHAVFDGFGKFLFDGTVAGVETYLNAKKLDASTRGYTIADGVLKGAVDSARQATTNATGGLLRARTNAGVRTVQGRIVAVRHISEGVGASFAWWEENSFSDITIANDSDTPASYNVITEYGYDNTLFRFLTWAYLPMTKSEVIIVAPNTSATVRVYYKRGAQDGSPRAESNIGIALIGVNDTGFFQSDYSATSWRPERRLLGVNRSKSAPVPPAEAVAPTYATPLDVYVLGDAATQTYSALLMVSNPLTATIRVDVSQALPDAATLVETDGVATGTAVNWRRDVLPGEIVQLHVRFGYPLVSDPIVQLPAAQITLVNQATGAASTVVAPPAGFTPAWPLEAQISVPEVQFGEVAAASVVLKNQTPAAVDGQLHVSVRSSGSQHYQHVQAVSVSASSQGEYSFPLPETLSPGMYSVEVWHSIGGAERRLAFDILVVRGASVALPLVNR
jgi:hypothetical protein